MGKGFPRDSDGEDGDCRSEKALREGFFVARENFKFPHLRRAFLVAHWLLQVNIFQELARASQV